MPAKKSAKKIAPTTGIGSLPHHNVDAALQYSFQHDIPFLPQLPLKNPQEYMIGQALEHLPGMVFQGSSKNQHESALDLKKWLQVKDRYAGKMDKALRTQSYDDFLPSQEMMSAWPGFLFELEERQVKWAKLQICGPLTLQLILKLTDGGLVRPYPELLSHITKTVLLTSLAMCAELKKRGVRPILFIDEPGLYAYQKNDGVTLAAFQDLKLTIMALKKENIQVGVHCCCNTDWAEVLSLPLDYLSFDVDLSLPQVLAQKTRLKKFFAQGGNLALGIIPTSQNSQIGRAPRFEVCQGLLSAFFKDERKEYSKIIRGQLLTTACGLAFKSASDAEDFLAELKGLQNKFRRSS